MKTKVLTKLFMMGTLAMQMACTAELMNKEATAADKAETYTLERDWQKVLRYNCAGELVSDKVETVRSPTKYVAIAPKTTLNLHASRFQNRTNRSNAKLVVGEYSFTIDMAPTLLNLKVEEGLNEIEYSFLYCDEPKKNEKGEKTGECSHDLEVRESGSLFVRIVYQQNWLEGEKEIKPTEEECKRLEEEEKKQKEKALSDS